MNTPEQLTPSELAALQGYADRRPNTACDVADGGPMLESLLPSELRGVIRSFATRLLARRSG